MDVLIIIGLALLNGIFSMTEMALVSSRKFNLENAKRKGSKGAATAIELSEQPTRFLSTVQIGITLIGIIMGVYSGENLTKGFAIYLAKIEVIRPYANNIAVGLVVLFVTYVSIILGELFPKRLGMVFPERIAILLSGPMKVLSYVTAPFVWLLSLTNDLLLRLLGIRRVNDVRITEEEIKSIIKESADGGEIQDIEHDIVERVFELGDRRVNTLYTHSSDITYLNITDTWPQIVEKINSDKHSAYPVCADDDINNVLGIVLLKDLFIPNQQQEIDLQKYIVKPLYINEHAYAYRLLELFKKESIHYGIVVDEFGTTQGFITMDDVLDALLGDLTERGQEEYTIIEREDHTWLIDGQYNLVEFLKRFGIEDDSGNLDNITTVAGLVMSKSAKTPDVGYKVRFQKFEFEVIDKDGHRIDKIIMRILV